MKTIFSPDTKFMELTTHISLSKKNAHNINIDYRIMKCYNNWYLYQKQYYYFKEISNFPYDNIFTLNHLLGEQIANYFQIPTVHFVPAKVGNEEGIASLNFRNPNCLYQPYNLLEMSFFDTLKFYQENFASDNHEPHIISPLLRLIAFHIYTDLADLSDDNLLLSKNADGLSLAPIFDYDLLFTHDFDLNLTSYFYNTSVCSFEIPSKNFEYLLISYAEFKTYLTSFIDIDMDKILKEITEEYQLTNCERYFDEYKEEDEIKKEFIRSLHL